MALPPRPPGLIGQAIAQRVSTTLTVDVSEGTDTDTASRLSKRPRPNQE